MNIQTNVPFSTLTTMRLGGPARFFAEANSVDEMVALYRNAKKMQQSVYVIGGGSNLIVHDEGFDGLVIRNKIPGFEILERTDQFTTVKIGGGELWDDAVKRSVDMGLSGIETLSAIPGTVGAGPVQNIGAYGQEIADTVVSLEVYDTELDTIRELNHEDCGFSYRHSIFRGLSKGRYVILTVTLKLYTLQPQPPFYAGVQKYLDEHAITEFTVKTIRAAVIDIRVNKLPDPALLPNSGSFFKNAIVKTWQLNTLREKYPNIVAFKMDEDHHKLYTGWLIEALGLKGKTLHGMKVHEGNALVLINESAKNYADLAEAREEIISQVRDAYQVVIEQEPLEL